jgi:hypothetical protein
MLQPLKIKLPIALGICAFATLRPALLADTAGGNVTVVASKVSDGYQRAKLPDGSYQPEYYAFAEGGRWSGGASDPSVDRLPFMVVARTMAGPLESQNYIPTRDAGATKLLIVVYWGRTGTPDRPDDSDGTQNLQATTDKLAAAKNANIQQNLAATTSLNAKQPSMACGHFVTDTTMAAAGDQLDTGNAATSAMAVVAAENRSRDAMDAQNANMLGYESWWNETAAYIGTPREYRRQDMITELEQSRYFVILMAYDFQSMWKQRQHRLLWETRLSVRQHGIDFDKQLALMAQDASQYFGRDSHGLQHMVLPEGRVDVGALKSLGALP